MNPDKFILAPSPHMRRAAVQQLNGIVELLCRVTGETVKVEFTPDPADHNPDANTAPQSGASVASAPTPTPTPASPMPPPRQDIMNQHPLVKLAGEVLGARVVRVEPRPPSTPS